MKKVTCALLILLVIIATTGCKHHPEKIIGIKLYEYHEDFGTLVAKWKDMCINTAFISKELAANREFRQLLKGNKIGTYIIFPVFHNPEFLQQDITYYAITDKGEVSKDDWVEFVCPSRLSYRKTKISEASELVRELEPDGLSIDFIRQFVFWEMIYPDRPAESIDIACFCDSCMVSFCESVNIALPDTCLSVRQKAEYILTFHSTGWDAFRCDLIASMVKELTDTVRNIIPGIRINIHAVPWRDEDFNGSNIRVAGQDLGKIAPYADYLSPMCYSQMLKRDAAWIESVVREMDRKAPGMILPSIQVYPYYIDDPFTADDFRKCYSAALKSPSRGVVFFSWPLFRKDSARMEII